jgi:hypothetical protein
MGFWLRAESGKDVMQHSGISFAGLSTGPDSTAGTMSVIKHIALPLLLLGNIFHASQAQSGTVNSE